MLTPVAASSNADIHYQGPPAQSARTVPEQAGKSAPQATPADSAPMARVNILSLTGQLQFIHSMSVLAETLSTIVNLPRRPGESAEDHIERLVTRIRSLPPSERRVVEAQLNLLLQGATLKALAEALKNPSGPDAARLAVMLEMSRYKDRDLAARAAVTSYRQNSGTDLPSSPAAARPVAPPSIPPSASGVNNATTGTGNAAPVPVIASALQKASEIATRYIADQSSAQPETAAPAKGETALASERPAASRSQGEVGNPSAIDTENAAGEKPDAGPPSPERLRNATAAPLPREKEILSGTAKPPLADATREVAMRATDRASERHRSDDGPDVADARHIRHESKDTGSIRQVAANITQAVQGNAAKGDSLTSFLLSVLVPGKAPMAAAAPPGAPLPAGDELAEQQNGRIKTDEATAATPRGLSGSPETDRPVTQDARAATVNAQQAELARNMAVHPEQQSLQAGAMIATVLGREAIVPLPYVAYLPAKDEPETPVPHRGNAPSGGEEEEEPPGEEQRDDTQDEQAAAETDEPAEDEALAETATEPRSAQDFYQRMSDWT